MITDSTQLGIPERGADYKSITSSPSGKYVVLTTVDGNLSIHPPSTTRATPGIIVKSHEGPVWDASFAPVEYGPLCASVGSDRKVIIHKEAMPPQWIVIYSEVVSPAPLFSCQFVACPMDPPNKFQLAAMNPTAPVGLHLAVASMDGSVIVLTLNVDNTWSKKTFLAHLGGCNVVRWSSLDFQADHNDRANPGHKLASAGVDGMVAISVWDSTTESWVIEQRLSGHYRNVIDICWMPANDTKDEKIASLSDDGTVILWSKPPGHRSWIRGQVLPSCCPSACRIDWSPDGSVIGLSTDDKNQRLRMFNVVQDTMAEAPLASNTPNSVLPDNLSQL